MLTPNLDKLLKPLPSVKNQSFLPTVKYSMKQLMPYLCLPLNFNLRELEMWRFSAHFYGFYYDTYRKNYSIWSNIMLKHNYGFSSSLFYRAKTMFLYKRLWYLNKNTWEFFSYMFKKSLSLNKNIHTLSKWSSILYKTQFHNSTTNLHTLFESSEIAIRMASSRHKNEWLIEDIDNELDHTISTYDRHREGAKNKLDKFRNKLKNHYHFVDSEFMSNSLYTVGYASNSVIFPRTYLLSSSFEQLFESASNSSGIFTDVISHTHLLFYMKELVLINSNSLLTEIDSYISFQKYNLIYLKYLLYIFSKYHNIGYVWNMKILYLFRILGYVYINNNLVVINSKHIINNSLMFNRFNSNNKKLNCIKKIKLSLKSLRKKIVNLYESYNFLCDTGSNINVSQQKSVKVMYNWSYYKLDYIDKYLSWIFVSKAHLNFMLLRFGRQNMIRLHRNSTVFLRRPEKDNYKVIFFRYFYNKEKFSIIKQMVLLASKLISFCSKLKWNVFFHSNIFYKRYNSMNNFYNIFINYIYFMKSKLIMWSESFKSFKSFKCNNTKKYLKNLCNKQKKIIKYLRNRKERAIKSGMINKFFTYIVMLNSMSNNKYKFNIWSKYYKKLCLVRFNRRISNVIKLKLKKTNMVKFNKIIRRSIKLKLKKINFIKLIKSWDLLTIFNHARQVPTNVLYNEIAKKKEKEKKERDAERARKTALWEAQKLANKLKLEEELKWERAETVYFPIDGPVVNDRSSKEWLFIEAARLKAVENKLKNKGKDNDWWKQHRKANEAMNKKWKNKAYFIKKKWKNKAYFMKPAVIIDKNKS